jgi:hypothetical protein
MPRRSLKRSQRWQNVGREGPAINAHARMIADEVEEMRVSAIPTAF